MKNFKNIEIISIDFDKREALISYQDPNKVADINNGYDTAIVPINLREIQYSARGNMLIDQSVKPDIVCAGSGTFK